MVDPSCRFERKVKKTQDFLGIVISTATVIKVSTVLAIQLILAVNQKVITFNQALLNFLSELGMIIVRSLSFIFPFTLQKHC